jgi:predicted Fe-Mo cluster-binding NifX family protein
MVMKIAITSTGSDLDADVDQRFGRAQSFVVVEVETGNFEVVDNTQNVSAAQGAGVQAAMNIAEKGIAYLLTGHCGPNAFRTLAGAGVKVITGVSGTVAEAVARFKNGEFEEVDAPDVEGHWT